MFLEKHLFCTFLYGSTPTYALFLVSYSNLLPVFHYIVPYILEFPPSFSHLAPSAAYIHCLKKETIPSISPTFIVTTP